MRRKVFDLLASGAGLLIVVVLVVGGALAMWGYSFASTNVHNQLAQQQIYFPPKSVWAHAKPGTEITPAMIPYLEKYSGQELLTGAQAEAYANHFIAIHLSEMPMGGVYSKLSAASLADPSNTTLANFVQLSFRGTTLRGLLLEAYAFGTFATIAFWAGITCFIGAALMAILVALGFRHARRTSDQDELLVHTKPAAVAAA